MFKVKGLRQAQRELDQLAKQIESEADAELKRIADGILADAVSRVHVRSGELKRSAFIEKIQGGWTIGFSASYAAFEEFGTGPLTEVPVGYEETAMEFFVSGKGYQPAHPYFFPAFLAKRDSIVDELEKAISKLVNGR